MAEIPVSFLLEKVMAMLSEEANLLGGLHREVEDIENERKGMQILLMTNETRADQTWVHDVRELAYDIEDCIDSFRLRIFALSRGREEDRRIGLLNKALHFLKTLPQRRQIAKEIQVTKAKVKRLHELRSRYGAKDSSTHQASFDWRNDALSAAPYVDRVHLVGMEERQSELMDWLLRGNRQLTVISLVGIGGLGKTTLAWNLFKDEQVDKSFQVKAWIRVSQQSNSQVLLRCLITQLFQSGQQSLPQGLELMAELQLVNLLECFLRNKKYMIILDDFKEYGIWECIASAFPNYDTGSRVMVTTQRQNIASYSTGNCGYLIQEYLVPHLREGQDWDLFRSRAFRANPGFGCPPHLGVAKRIAERCARLPLAIVTVGGLLANKPPTLDEWNRLDDSLITELQSYNEHASVRKILSLGYDDLPTHLKPCFLCFSAFPVIKQRRLMRIWIAEGFVGSVRNKKPEDVAMAYIKELINRCLIQVLDSFGGTEFCHVHGFMREILVVKCMEESFYKLLHEQQLGEIQPTNENDNQHGGLASHVPSSATIRRLLVRGNSPQVYQSMASLLQQSNCSSSLRSLIIAIGAPTSIPGPSPNPSYKFMKLRVLDLEGINIGRLSGQIASCRLLKYLSLRDTNLDGLPNSLGKLFDLETLDLRGTRITTLPARVINLHRLRYLLVPCPTSSSPIPKGTRAILHVTWYKFAARPGVKVPPGVGQLRSLVKLTLFDIGHCDGVLAELKNLTQLRKLGLRCIRREDGKELCATIEKMSCLQSLVLHSMGTDELLDLQSLSSPPELLENLFLAGPLGKLPTWAQSLHSIVKIVLMGSKLMDDLFEALQGLPILRHLYLIGAFSGKYLCSTTKGGFKELKILHLSYLNGLESVTVMEGAMPTLTKLSIWFCEALKEVPSGIEHLENLKELHLLGMPQEFDRMLRRDRGMEWGKLKHISLIRSSTLINSKDGNWSEWVDEDFSCDMQAKMEEEETEEEEMEEEDVEAITPTR